MRYLQFNIIIQSIISMSVLFSALLSYKISQINNMNGFIHTLSMYKHGLIVNIFSCFINGPEKACCG